MNSTKRRQLDALAGAERKPPKKAIKKRIGTLDVKTGKYWPRFPDVLPLPAREYDSLYQLVQWLEAAPPGVEPDEELFERAAGRVQRYVDRWSNKPKNPPGIIYVASLQIETKKSKTRDTEVGDLVALLDDEGSDTDGEHHCVLVRGKNGYGRK